MNARDAFAPEAVLGAERLGGRSPGRGFGGLGVGLGIEDVHGDVGAVAGLGEALLDEVGDLATVDGLLLEQRDGDEFEASAVLRDEVVRALLLVGEDAGDFLVEEFRGVV